MPGQPFTSNKPPAGKKGAKNAIANMEIDVAYYKKVLQKMKPNGVEKQDIYFRKFIEEEGKPIIKIYWKTIFMDELSALYKVIEIVDYL